MAYFVLYVDPNGPLPGTDRPKEDGGTFRAGQAISMGSSSPFPIPNGYKVFKVPDEHLENNFTILKRKRFWDEATQTVVVDTSKGDITKSEFVARFTDSEWDNLEEARLTGTTQEKKRINGFLSKLSFVERVNLDSPGLNNFITQLEARGIIGVGRASQIMAEKV